jgi:hypothetical protein
MCCQKADEYIQYVIFTDTFIQKNSGFGRKLQKLLRTKEESSVIFPGIGLSIEKAAEYG